MSGGPPLGQPWCANVGNNPNINRDPPPPPLNVVQGAPPAAYGQPAHQVIEHHHQAPIYGPPVPIGIGGPPIGLAPAFGFAQPFGVGVGLGMLPPPMGIMDPFMYGGGGGGPLAPIRAGNFLPGAHGGIGFGLHAGGMPFPPPPPGALAGGVVPAFAPAAPLWAPGGGLAFGNVPAGIGGGMMGGMMMPGMMMGGGGMYPHDRPAPMFVDGNGGPPAQPEQGEITAIAGGVAPGITLVESAEHTIVVQVKGNVCPWLSPGAQFPVERFQMASTTGLNRLIQVCNNGAPADDCENMAVTECIELGNGLWEKGQTFKYNDAVSRVLTLKDAGWDNKRNRQGGQSLHLWSHRI